MKYVNLGNLVCHPKNVRAKTDYPEGSIEALAANISALGLLQGLVVQQLDDGTFGVLAGRRRMMAMQLNAANGDMDEDFKVPCKAVSKDIDHVTAISLAENAMQQAMDPLDEFEAFSAMVEQGSGIEQIAETFGTTVRAVKERLRYGMIHRDIRDAARAKTITLDAMKAYAMHPCVDTQKRVYDHLMAEGTDHSAYRVRNILRDQDIRSTDPLAKMVTEHYRERGGEMVEGLFEEDTVLKDRALAEKIRDEMLTAEGEIYKAATGFGWFETRVRIDYSELSAYGRIHVQIKELTETQEERLTEIAERIDVIYEKLEDEETAPDDHYALNDEHAALELEVEEIQCGYREDQKALAGFIITPDGNGAFSYQCGLVRAENCAALLALDDEQRDEIADAGEDGDMAEPSASPAPSFRPPSTGAGFGGPGSGAKEKPHPLSQDALSAALRADLASQRATILDCELANDPVLARDAMIFQMAQSLLSTRYASRTDFDIAYRNGHRPHSQPEALDAGVQSDIAAARDGLDLSFFDAAMSAGDQFRAFREIDDGMKDRIMAVCIGMTVQCGLAQSGPEETFMDALASEAVEDIRTIWKPTTENYWGRVTRDHMLSLLKAFGMTAEAVEHQTVKNATLASYMEKLFARPFATLSDAQRTAVEAWTPPGMGTQGDMVFEGAEDEDEEPVEDGTDGDMAYSNLEPGERVIGTNADGDDLIEDENGVRSITIGGVKMSEPVEIVSTGQIIGPNTSDRKPRFLTAEESAALCDAA